MMAHLWGDPPATGELLMDPASGTDAAGNLKTTKYNDFANFRWLGALSGVRSEEHTSELQSQSNLVCRLLLEKKKKNDRENTARLRKTRTLLWQRTVNVRSTHQ